MLPFLFVASLSFAVEVTQGTAFSLTATADGTAPFTYQWSRNGAVIPSYTSPVVNVPSATADMTGTYSVLISNKAGSTTASVAIAVKSVSPIVVPPTNAKVTFDIVTSNGVKVGTMTLDKLLLP